MIGSRAALALFAVGFAGCSGDAVQSESRSNLAHIGAAMSNYYSQYGVFPPATLSDTHGKHFQGWRGLLVPQTEKNPPPFNSRIPWNAPHNLQVGSRPMRIYCGSNSTVNTTRYLAVVGDECLMRSGSPVKIARLTKPLSEIAVVIDVGGTDIPWSKPGDMPFGSMLDKFGKRSLGPFPDGVLTVHHLVCKRVAVIAISERGK